VTQRILGDHRLRRRKRRRRRRQSKHYKKKVSYDKESDNDLCSTEQTVIPISP
jgi:hypothetical protein